MTPENNMESLSERLSEFVVHVRQNSIIRMLVLALLIASSASAQVNILTNRYDGERTGANLNETKLTTSNVSVDQFGKLYAYPVDGAVYAQPLYVRGVVIGGTAHNLLYIATMNDKVYAFDADSSSATPLWMRDFTSPPTVTPVPIIDIVGVSNLNIVGNVGIQSTPVIDSATGTIYLVARTKESGAYVQRLHALDIATGGSRPGSGLVITGSVEGTGDDATAGATGSVITFNPKMHSQRAALALTNGVVLISWASHEDLPPYHGWIMGYDARSLAQVGVFAVTRDSYSGGIWQGGRAPTIDAAGNAYFATGNGKWDGSRNLGDSLLKFSVSRGGLSLIDYFTPANQATLDSADDDLSGSGFTLLPGNLLVGGGKEGVLYLLNADNLGRQAAKDLQIPQKIPVGGGHIMGGPVYWNSTVAGPLVYNWSEDDVLKAYTFTGGRLGVPPYAQGQVMSPGHPGGSLTISANAGAAGTGIVWASMPTLQDGDRGKVAGVLRAFDAETLRELWTSEQNATRDRVGTLMKFVPPVVVNGKVYLPNHDGALAVYGRLPVTTPDFSLSVAPSTTTIPAGGSDTFSVTITARNGFTGAVSLSATGQPSGATVGFNPSSVIGSGASTMTVSVPASASGTFSITVRGVSGSLAHTAAATVVTSTTAAAGAIGVNFVGGSPSLMGAAETAGVVSQPNWNNATGATRSALALVDRSGVATGATATWSATGVWMTPVTDAAGNARMMKGYLDTTSTSTTTVRIAGLAQRAYDVYVYADGDNKVYERSAGYTISGSGIIATTINLTDKASTNYTSGFTRSSNSAGNYVKFSINATDFTITATPIGPVDATKRAPINGIQIVPVAFNAIGISFVGTSPTPMGPTETAGVIAQPHWNNAAGGTRTTPLSLIDASGTASPATVTWTSNGSWMLPTSDAAGNRRMMKGYLDTSSTSATTVTVAGLSSGDYDVYVYVDGDNHEFTRTATYRMSTTASSTTVSVTDPANTNFGGTFTEAAGARNYVRFRISGTGFTLTATPSTSTNATLRAPVNAIQIVGR